MVAAAVTHRNEKGWHHGTVLLNYKAALFFRRLGQIFHVFTEKAVDVFFAFHGVIIAVLNQISAKASLK